MTYQHQVLQIIEGKHDTLSELYLRIANDPRHSQVQLLTFEAITKRNFSNWKMKEIAIERLPDDIQSTLSLLMPIEDNHRQLPTEANKAEALLTLIAAITSER